MKNKRLLSILLSFTMIITCGFTTGVLADEEPVYTESYVTESAAVSAVDEGYVEETVIPDEESYAVDEASYYEEEIVYDDAAVDGQSFTEPEVIDYASDDVASADYVDESADYTESYSVTDEYVETYSEAAEEIPAAEEPAEFTQGYVKIKKDTVVYKAESTQEEAGTFTEDSIVYAIVTTPGSVTDDSWMWIVFDTEEAKAAEAEVPSAYVQYKDVVVLTDEEVEQLNNEFAVEPTTRAYQEKSLQVVSFASAVVPDLTEAEEFYYESSAAETVSDEAYAAVSSPITITSHPESVSADVNDIVSFTVAASGSNLKYQWEYKAAGSDDWVITHVTGYNTNTITVKVTSARINASYRCVVSDSAGNSVPSDEATINPAAPSGPTITSDPSDVYAALNSMVSFSVEATGSDLTYQWEFQAAGSDDWVITRVSGYNTNTLTVKVTSTRVGASYRCVVTDSNGNSVASKGAMISVGPVITKDPEDVSTSLNSTVSFSIDATGTGLTYQWEFLGAGSEDWVITRATGYNTKTLTVKVNSSRVGASYRCVVTDSNGNSVASKGALITVGTAGPEITKDPEDITTSLNSTVSFSIDATGTGLTYQWEFLGAGSEDWVITRATGYNTKTLTVKVNSSRVGASYRCVVTDANGNSVASKGALITVGTAGPEITKDPEDVTTTLNSTVSFTIDATGSDLTYQWEFLGAGSDKWVITRATGYNTNTLTIKVNSSRVGASYRCVVTDSSGRSVASKGALITVETAGPEITKDPEDITTSLNSTVSFSIEATGSGLTYQWEYLGAGSENWVITKATGYNTNTLTVKVNASRVGASYRCVVTDSNGRSVASKGALITVLPEITKDPEDAVGKLNSNVQFSISATGSNLKYQWEFLAAGSDQWVITHATGYNTNTLTVKITEARVGASYRCVVTDANGNQATSKAAMISLDNIIIVDDVTYEGITETTCRIVSYNGQSTALVIPDTIEGMTVTEVGPEAFMNNAVLVSIDLPDTIVVIRERAFKNCSSLKEML